MKRRNFITLLGRAAAWLLTARAQQSVPIVWDLGTGVPEGYTLRVAALRQGLPCRRSFSSAPTR